MLDPAVALTDEILTDYLFGKLDLNRQIQVEFALSKNPELAASIAGCRARMLAIKRLADNSLDNDVPAALIAPLKPLLDDQRLALQPEQMASWLIDGHVGQNTNGRDRGDSFLYNAES